MSWKPTHVYCGNSTRNAPDHAALYTDPRNGSGCLVCQLVNDNNALRAQVTRAATLLHEGKVVQAHQHLMCAPTPVETGSEER